MRDNRIITSADLYYRRKGPREYTKVAMVKLSGDYYTAEIPGAEVTFAGVEYYLSASDGLWESTQPTNAAPISPFSLTVVDTTPPTIEHTPVREAPVKSSPEITAKVTDAVKVERVSLFHKIRDDRYFTKIDMTAAATPGEYTASIPALDQPGIVEYYVEAVDSSSNSRTYPEGGSKDPQVITFVDTEPPVIVHTPISDGQEASIPVTVGATITDNVGVKSVIFKYKSPIKKEFIEAKMTSVGSYYTAEIPGIAVVPGKIEYTITASDGSPYSKETQVSYSFTVVDTTPPTIELITAPSKAEVNTDISIQAKVTDNVKVEAVTLYYKGIGDLKFNSVNMSALGNRYSAIIPKQTQIGEVKYYIYAKDSQGISATEPSVDPENSPRSITVTDTSNPVIQHTPVSGKQEAGVPVTITAKVTDNVEVAEVSLHYRTAGQAGFKLVPMAETSTKSFYSGIIPGPDVIPPGIEYYIKAMDSSNNSVSHPAADPDKVPNSFQVVDTVPPKIVYDPSKLEKVLITEPIVVTAEVTDLGGIKGVKVFYKGAAQATAPYDFLVCKDTGDNKFSATIPSPQGKGRIDYYIQAEDNSA